MNGLKSSAAISFGKPLVHFQFRTYHDNRTTWIVNTFTQQVLTETTFVLPFSTSLNDFSARPPSALTAFDLRLLSNNESVLPATSFSRYEGSLQELWSRAVASNGCYGWSHDGRDRSDRKRNVRHRVEQWTKFRWNNWNVLHNHPFRTVLILVFAAETFYNTQTLQCIGFTLLLGFVGLQTRSKLSWSRSRRSSIHEQPQLPSWRWIFWDLHQAASGFLLEVHPGYLGILLPLKRSPVVFLYLPDTRLYHHETFVVNDGLQFLSSYPTGNRSCLATI